MKTYTVHAEWDETGCWVVTVPEVSGAVTQSCRLDLVSGDVAEVLELLTGETSNNYDLDLQWSVPGHTGDEPTRVREVRAEAARLSREASWKLAAVVSRPWASGAYRPTGPGG